MNVNGIVRENTGGRTSIFAFKGQITDGDLKGVLIGPFDSRELAAEDARAIGGGVADLTFIAPAEGAQPHLNAQSR